MDQPQGWRERATVLEVAGLKATCLSPLDLAYNKLNAGREKDITYVAALLTHRIITASELKEFVNAGSPAYRLDENLTRFKRALTASQETTIQEQNHGDRRQIPTQRPPSPGSRSIRL